MHRPGVLTAVVVISVVFGPGRVHAETFADILGTPFTRPISDALAGSVARALPVVAASAGFVFTYDPETGIYEREAAISGQLFLERAQPVGRRRWNVGLSYQRVKFDRIEGKDIEELQDLQPIVDPGTGIPVTFPRFDLDLETNEITGSATYGVTDDLDVNLTVPLLVSDFTVRLEQHTQGTPGVQRFTAEETKAGVGDVFLRGKYRLLAHGMPDLAAGLVLRLPAGNEENFQGTGTFEVGPFLYAGTRPIDVAGRVRLQPYLNAGLDLNTDDVGASQGRWGLGLDGAIGRRATLAVAVLARYPFRRVAPAGFFTVQRTNGSERPLFGINGERANLYDASIGGRVNLWHDVVIAFANVIVPLNPDEGLRALAIPTVGVEAIF